MTADEAKVQYIAALNAIIAADPIAGLYFAQRTELEAQTPRDLVQITALTNRINNTASDEVQAALKALRTMRA